MSDLSHYLQRRCPVADDLRASQQPTFLPMVMAFTGQQWTIAKMTRR